MIHVEIGPGAIVDARRARRRPIARGDARKVVAAPDQASQAEKNCDRVPSQDEHSDEKTARHYIPHGGIRRSA